MVQQQSFVAVVISNHSLAWPDLLRTGAYPLEIISAVAARRL